MTILFHMKWSSTQVYLILRKDKIKQKLVRSMIKKWVKYFMRHRKEQKNFIQRLKKEYEILQLVVLTIFVNLCCLVYVWFKSSCYAHQFRSNVHTANVIKIYEYSCKFMLIEIYIFHRALVTDYKYTWTHWIEQFCNITCIINIYSIIVWFFSELVLNKMLVNNIYVSNNMK